MGTGSAGFHECLSWFFNTSPSGAPYSSARPPLPEPPAQPQHSGFDPMLVRIAVAGALLALALLAVFYSVVTSAVQKADAEHQRLLADTGRTVACGSSQGAAARSLCQVIAPAPIVNALVETRWEGRLAGQARRGEVRGAIND